MSWLHAGERGASLLEALIAALVAVTLSVGVLPLVVSSIAHMRMARDTSAASRLAWQKVEEVLGQAEDPGPSPGASLDRDTPGFVERLDDAGRVVPAGGVYVRRWLVEATDGAPGAPLRVVAAVFHTRTPARPVVVATLRGRRAR